MPSPPKLQILAQRFGNDSVGKRLASELEDGDWQCFGASVAFLKQSGLQYVAAPLHAFLSTPGHDAIISVGIDHDGTSLEGLQNLGER